MVDGVVGWARRTVRVRCVKLSRTKAGVIWACDAKWWLAGYLLLVWQVKKRGSEQPYFAGLERKRSNSTGFMEDDERRTREV
jgi:hypothetical protein